jgi:thioredoxin reductase
MPPVCYIGNEVCANPGDACTVVVEVDTMTDRLNEHQDVLVIGGGAAGLSGALMLARSRRSVAVIDAGSPRNAPADAVHGLLGRDGTPPADLLERGRAEVRSYGGRVVCGKVATVTRVAGNSAGEFEVKLTDGRTARARRLLVATGLTDELPDVPGLRERWGHDVIHCPYCHGWEVRDQAIGVLASGPMSVHQALLFRQLSDDVMVFTHTSSLTGEQWEELAARGIGVVEGKVTSLEVTGDERTGDRLTGVRLSDGTTVARDVLVVAPTARVRAGFLAALGLRPAEHPAGEHIPAGPHGHSDVPGVWLAGNVTDPSAQVGAAAAAGAMAGAMINADLSTEETRRALAARRVS